MCEQRLSDGPLVCVRADPHERGHVYESTTVSDKHDASEGMDE